MITVFILIVCTLFSNENVLNDDLIKEYSEKVYTKINIYSQETEEQITFANMFLVKAKDINHQQPKVPEDVIFMLILMPFDSFYLDLYHIDSFDIGMKEMRIRCELKEDYKKYKTENGIYKANYFFAGEYNKESFTWSFYEPLYICFKAADTKKGILMEMIMEINEEEVVKSAVIFRES